ncbi:mechanosensitive ion channel domain-containing protein [Subtercola endophyticus]|uniref:mechanosensitive ion channel domain-containing protein n=1 Tax=Subtercola endophyticus TaxID=2895559 RepID=UPI001E5D6169|nr:mechanosensitive ion channel domain-containing protein [Subtercola endophyticus]UFS59634.1 mechanosensitive ion channel [Subtercola endophyticus]
MAQIWNEPWFGLALTIAIGLPILLVILTEVLAWLVRREHPAAKPVRLLRNLVLPVGALLALLSLASNSTVELTWTRVVATAFGFLVILLVLSSVNVVLFGNPEEGSWRERLPSIFIDLARLGLILVGLALLFSWVWDADVGGLITALGVTSIVIGLALQNAVGSVISGLLLLFEQPFKLGDWLDTGKVVGRVVEVNWRAVHIDTGNGIQIVPNASLAGASFTNLSQAPGAFMSEATVKFSTDDPPHQVLDLMQKVAAGLPMRQRSQAIESSYAGSATYSISIPVTGPAEAPAAAALFLAWLWYAARRAGLALDGDATDPVQTPERLESAIAAVGTRLQLTVEDHSWLPAECRLEQYGHGEIIHVPGTIPDAFRFVIDGAVRLSASTPLGDVGYLTLAADEFFGLMALSRQVDPGSVVADGTTTVLRITTSAVDRLISEYPSLARQIGRVIDLRMQTARDAVAALGIESGTTGA